MLASSYLGEEGGGRMGMRQKGRAGSGWSWSREGNVPFHCNTVQENEEVFKTYARSTLSHLRTGHRRDSNRKETLREKPMICATV